MGLLRLKNHQQIIYGKVLNNRAKIGASFIHIYNAMLKRRQNKKTWFYSFYAPFKRGKFFFESGTIAPNAALQLHQRLIWLELIEASPFVGKLIRGVDLYL